MDALVTVHGCERIFGFPFIADETLPPLELHMALPGDAGNVSGEIELHGRGFVIEPGIEITFKLRGETLTTIHFVPAEDGVPSQSLHPDLSRQLNRHLESLLPVM